MKKIKKIAALLLLTINVIGDGIISRVLSKDKLLVENIKESSYNFVLLTMVSFFAKYSCINMTWYENVAVLFFFWYLFFLGTCFFRRIDIANKSRWENEKTYSIMSLAYKIPFTYIGVVITKRVIPGVFVCVLMVSFFKFLINKILARKIVNSNEWYLAAARNS